MAETDIESSGVTEPRLLDPWLLLGVLAVPILFVWFLLRPGYSTDVRVGGSLHMAVGVLAASAASLQHG